MKIGIDIGGTNTHVVLVSDQGRLVVAAKHMTTSDILTGVYCAVKSLFERTSISPAEIKGIFIGTTQVINALFEEKLIAKTALIRIGNKRSKITPALNWPPALKSFLKEVFYLESNNCYNGTSSQVMDYHNELELICQKIANDSVEAICIVGTYSPMFEAEELHVKNEIKKRIPNISVTTSYQLGSIGYIERENTSLLNTLLSKVSREILDELASIFSSLSLTCPFWLTQNNGSLMTVQEAIEFPVLTIASGVTNSLRGAAIISSLKDMIAVDIGGSKIYAGRVRNGQLKEVTMSTNFFGIDASLVIPEFITLPFGGGSLTSIENGQVNILPSISTDIEKEGLAWGGESWTVSDSFLKLFPLTFYDQKIDVSRLECLPFNECNEVVRYVMSQLKSVLDLLQDHESELPVVLVGGGSPLFNERLFGKYKRVMNPSGYPISGAIGACFAPVSGVIDKVYWLNNRSKEEIIEEAVSTCKNIVLEKGANPSSIQVSYVEEYPFAYLRGEILRVKTKATGELIL